jgi:hypothetical protein
MNINTKRGANCSPNLGTARKESRPQTQVRGPLLNHKERQKSDRK